ncbi:hypothetical protein BG011_001777 [Mortierella polycephala]|uniref:Uncharacterized protein n=1 Tax=Mortierella polycephala TaxID=41804 RepID=A0A9P6QIY0_9FUNG|nr:hypothetical protein BG011_001777 [Mortierella polycephala]
MGRRLSLFCSCLPRKQRDNLSSRSLYHDQDSGPEDYTDDDNDDDNDDEYYDYNQHHSRARLEFLRPSSTSHSSDTYNPWPSNLSNGRFSRHANRSSLGRKPIPFKIPYRDDESEDDDRTTNSNNTGEGADGRTTRDTFVPYRDDDGGDQVGFQDRNALNDLTRIYPREEYSPYRVKAGFPSLTLTGEKNARRQRTPRNPHGKMIWDGEADAEEVLDVDALIAEQERITRELAAQEEALSKEEEAVVVAKRLAAIRAAERRGLLRFDGDQLVIPTSGSDINSGSNSNNAADQIIKSQEHTLEDDGEWNYPRRKERTPSSSASSFVGGIDAMNQELKMMSMEINNKNNHVAETVVPLISTSIPTPPSTTRSTESPSTAAIAAKSTPKMVSASTTTSTAATTNQASLNPRGVLNNITSFLKKVDGVIAGESGDSSDETSFSDQEQALGTNRTTYAKDPQERGNNVDAEESKRMTMADHIDPQEQPYPADPFNTVTDQAQPPKPEDQKSSSSSISGRHHRVIQHDESEPHSAYSAAPTSASEGIFETFTSFFNTGSSFMGFFGTGHHDEHEREDYPGEGGRRLSSLKYGDPKKHEFNYRDHHLEDSSTSNAGRAANQLASTIDDDDGSSIDDYDF